MNQSFTVTPDERQDNAFDEEVNVTVSGLTSETVDIALVSCEDVTIDEDGVVSFADTNNNNRADDLGATAAVIESVDGTTQAANTRYLNDVNVDADEDNAVSFQVDSAADDCVIAVVFDDADDDNELDLDANDQPTEDFGITGELQFTPGEANFGAQNGVVVDRAETDEDYFVGTGGGSQETYFYDATDNYILSTGGSDITLTMAQFEGLLTEDDVIDVVYNTDPAGDSTFTVQTDAVPAPETVTATVGDSNDADTVANDVTITWTRSEQDDALYDVFRDTGATPDVIDGTDTQVANNVSGTSVTVEDQPNGTYDYIVRAQGGLSGVDGGVEDSNDVTVTTDPEAPESTEAVVTNDVPVDGVADSGDEWRIVFDEAVDVTDGDIIRVQDAHGEFANLVCDADGAGAAEADCTTNNSTVTIDGDPYEAGEVLTVVITGPITIEGDNNAGVANTALLEYPLTIIGQVGIEDLSGNDWTPTDDPDNTLEVNESAPATTAIAPEMQSAAGTDGGGGVDTVTVTYSEAVDCNDTEDDQFTLTDGDSAAVLATALACDGDNTIVLTFPTDTLDAGATTIGYTEGTVANRVLDLDGTEAVSPETQAYTQA